MHWVLILLQHSWLQCMGRGLVTKRYIKDIAKTPAAILINIIFSLSLICLLYHWNADMTRGFLMLFCCFLTKCGFGSFSRSGVERQTTYFAESQGAREVFLRGLRQTVSYLSSPSQQGSRVRGSNSALRTTQLLRRVSESSLIAPESQAAELKNTCSPS